VYHHTATAQAASGKSGKETEEEKAQTPQAEEEKQSAARLLVLTGNLLHRHNRPKAQADE